MNSPRIWICPLGVEASAAARAAVCSVLRSWGFDDEVWLYDARLIVSELVANAVRHGGGCLALHLQAHELQVIIAAVDGSAVVPRRREGDDTGGRGVAIIGAVADAWGVHDHDGGKRVWVRLPPHPAKN